MAVQRGKIEIGAVVDPSRPSKLIDSGSFIVTKVSRPPRRAPAVSKTAPDSSVRALSSAHDSSFCTGSYLLPTTPRHVDVAGDGVGSHGGEMVGDRQAVPGW